MSATSAAILQHLFKIPEDLLRLVLTEAELHEPLPERLSRRRAPGWSWGIEDQHASEDWVAANEPKLLTGLMRVIDPSNAEVAALLSPGYVPSEVSEYQLIISFDLPGDRNSANESHPYRITDLASASAMLTEIYLAVASANLPLGVVSEPPQVELRSGSIQFSTSGALLPVGIGLVLACATGGLAAPAGFYAGGVLATFGVVDTFLAWRRTIAEREKLRQESAKFAAETQKLHAEAEKLAAEARRLEMELEQSRFQAASWTDENYRRADASIVPRRVVKEHAERLSLSEPYATHLLNRSLGAAGAVRRTGGAIKAEISRKSGRRRGSPSNLMRRPTRMITFEDDDKPKKK